MKTTASRSRPRIRATVPAAVLVLALSIIGQQARAEPPAAVVQALQGGADGGGDLVLGQYKEFQDTYLSRITIQRPHVADDGTVSGTTTFAGRDARVLIQYFEREIGGIGHWLCAIKVPLNRLADLVPGTAGTVIDDIELSESILIFSEYKVSMQSDQLAPAVRDFYAEVYGDEKFSLSVSDGVNFLSSAQPSSTIDRGLSALGMDVERFVLQGVLLKNFDGAALDKARQDGKLIQALAKDAELTATLRNTSMAGLPKGFQAREFGFLVTGEPAVGLQFWLTIGEGPAARDFQCRAKFVKAKDQPELKEVAISAKTSSDQPWQNALGIDGLNLKSAAIEMKYEMSKTGPPGFGMGVSGEMLLGRRYVGIAGGLTSKAGVLTGFFQGRVDRLTREDLASIANSLSPQRGTARFRPVRADSLPEFELRDVAFLYAPLGGSDALGVQSGVGLKGQLYMHGSAVAAIDGLIDLERVAPVVGIKGSAADIDLGGVSLRDAKVDVLMATPIDSHFRIKGKTSVLGSSAEADVERTVLYTKIQMAGRLAGVVDANVSYTSPTRADPAWEMNAAIKNEFTRTLENQISDDLDRWSRGAQAELNQASRTVASAKSRLNEIDRDIRAARDTVQGKRRQQEQDLQRAKDKVAGIQKQISDRRASIQRDRARKLATLKSAKDRAYSSYKKAKRAYEKASRLKKPALKLAMEAKYRVYKTAKGAYDRAAGAINRVPIDADPTIVALQSSAKASQLTLDALSASVARINRTPVDLDPLVAAPLARRAAAQAALTQAEKGLRDLGNVTRDVGRISSYAAANNGRVLMIDSAQLQGKLSAYLAGSKMELEMKVRVLGEAKTVRLSTRPVELRADKLAAQLIGELFPQRKS